MATPFSTVSSNDRNKNNDGEKDSIEKITKERPLLPGEERTLVLLKPECTDAIRIEILSRLRLKMGWKIYRLRCVDAVLTEHMEQHYAEHAGKDFFPALVQRIVSETNSKSPIYALLIQGRDAVASVRKMIGGAADPKDCAPGTVRFDCASEKSRNCIHASDSVQAAEREIQLWFQKSPDKIGSCVECMALRIVNVPYGSSSAFTFVLDG
jgi:nucleoside-diphosphate kinase